MLNGKSGRQGPETRFFFFFVTVNEEPVEGSVVVRWAVFLFHKEDLRAPVLAQW